MKKISENNFNSVDISSHKKTIYSKDDIAKIRCGYLAQTMESKWHLVYEENKLYFIRSWTGKCIYIFHFKEENDGYIIERFMYTNNTKNFKPNRNMLYYFRVCLYLVDEFLLDIRSSFPSESIEFIS
jgi:hypothetical protein